MLSCFHIARHLAAEFGTRLAVFCCIGLLCIDDFDLGWCYCVLFGKRYCPQIEMISVVKNGNVGLLLAALAIISRTCIFST